MYRKLLHNAQKFCYKMRRSFVTKCARCYTMRSCYKMPLNKPASGKPYPDPFLISYYVPNTQPDTDFRRLFHL